MSLCFAEESQIQCGAFKVLHGVNRRQLGGPTSPLGTRTWTVPSQAVALQVYICRAIHTDCSCGFSSHPCSNDSQCCSHFTDGS